MNKLALVFSALSRKVLLATATVALSVGSVQANPYMELGCAGCHGDAGQGTSAPALAGKDAAYIVKALKDFQSGARKNATMNAMAGMAAGQEQAIADFLASASVSTQTKATADKTPEQTKVKVAENIALGQAKSAVCIGCHGVNGNSVVSSFPKLAGQSEAYLLKQLREFKTSDRVDAVMLGMVMSLTDTDMQNIAAYYATQTISQGAAKKDANIALGEKIYRGGKKATGTTACIACHGPKGRGIPAAGFPALSSQHAAYVAQQLKLFRQDSINAQTGATEPSRTNDYEGMMINFAKSLTNAEIDAVSAYIERLH